MSSVDNNNNNDFRADFRADGRRRVTPTLLSPAQLEREGLLQQQPVARPAPLTAYVDAAERRLAARRQQLPPLTASQLAEVRALALQQQQHVADFSKFL